MRAVAHRGDRRFVVPISFEIWASDSSGWLFNRKEIASACPGVWRWACSAASVFVDLGRKRLRRELEPRLRVGLAALDLLRRRLAVRHRIEALHLVRHFAVCDGLDLERMQLAEIGDLLKGQRGVLDQPYGGCLGINGAAM